MNGLSDYVKKGGETSLFVKLVSFAAFGMVTDPYEALTKDALDSLYLRAQRGFCLIKNNYLRTRSTISEIAASYRVFRDIRKIA